MLQSDYPVDVIVVDNASQDDTLVLLESFKSVHVIKSAVNLGFGKANNIGIDCALKNGAEAVFLLNQDTWIFENTIGALVEKLLSNPEFGILSPIHFSKKEHVLDTNFETYYNRKIATTKNNIAQVPFVNAAAWLVSKDCLEKAGFFEPLFDHYGEDRNYCDRVIFHQFKIGIIEESQICHDRTIVRNFKKDILQSKYKILNETLNINHSFLKSFFMGLRQIIGLPKYFFKFYGWSKSIQLSLHLAAYFFSILNNSKKIITIRKNAIEGTNGRFTNS